MNQDTEFKNEFRVKGSEKLLSIIRSFSATEKVVFGFFTIIFILSSLTLTYKAGKIFMVEIPSHGGEFTEGIIGLPRSINPVLAFTDVDKDLSTLVYSGLVKYENNDLIPDIASKYDISNDGLIYSFTLKDNVKFHDGVELTTDDIEFTIQKIQDSAIKSPKKTDWAGVTIKKINDKEIQFILKQPYAPFLSNLTLGITPKHIWKNLDADQFVFSEYNLEPIGSGPYKVEEIIKNKSGIPTKYTFSSFKKFYNGEPYISNVNINFYSNEKLAIEAYTSGEIENFAGISPKEISPIASSSKNINILHTPLPRIFGIFFNQNNSQILANKEVRQALNLVIDRDEIINKVLYGYGASISGPLPREMTEDARHSENSDEDIAKEILTKAGWQINKDGILEKKSTKKTGGSAQVLELSISTSDAEDLKQIAEMVKVKWENLGAKVNVKVFEFGDLSQNIIKTRKYDALLYGEAIGKNIDLYAFWHSSQKNYPGLNVAMYVNSKVDKILEEARSNSNENERNNLYESFNQIIQEDIPAIFIYSPEYIYLMSNKINGNTLKNITSASDRFYGIDKWYITTDYVWKIFKNKIN